MSEPTIEPSAEQIKALAGSLDQEGPIAMVNLLRFREEALAPDEGMSGAEAYGVYSQGVMPFLEGAGGKVLSAVSCGESVIGPADPEWHMAIIVEYPSRAAFLGMVGNADYQEVARHRTAALADSRLILSTRLA
ncbi:MAG: DUF1330 domain-containing protein [Solirubrobacterales bacterium]